MNEEQAQLSVSVRQMQQAWIPGDLSTTPRHFVWPATPTWTFYRRAPAIRAPGRSLHHLAAIDAAEPETNRGGRRAITFLDLQGERRAAAEEVRPSETRGNLSQST
jgi:hypothetical protein